MIIGKGGSYIKQIKEQTGAYIQISQKPKDISLPERCITVSGNNREVVNFFFAFSRSFHLFEGKPCLCDVRKSHKRYKIYAREAVGK